MSIAERIEQMNLSRRDAVRLAIFGGVGIAASAGVFASASQSALAAGDAGGAAGTVYPSGGGGGTGDTWWGGGTHYIWFDRGGFYGHGTSPKEPVQGWGCGNTGTKAGSGDSGVYFLGLMEAYMKKVTGDSALHFCANQYRSKPKRTNKEEFLYQCEQACQKAIDRATARSRELGSYYSGLARVVGIGWTHYCGYQYAGGSYGTGDRHGWEFCFNWNHSFSELMLRSGTVHDLSDTDRAFEFATKEFSKDAGWGEKVDVPGYTNLDWSDYIYTLGKNALTERGYAIVVLAVADGELQSNGFMNVSKDVVF